MLGPERPELVEKSKGEGSKHVKFAVILRQVQDAFSAISASFYYMRLAQEAFP